MRYRIEIFLVGTLAVLVFACGERAPERGGAEPPRPLNEAPRGIDAQALYRNAGCATCHRMPGDPGQPLAGPPLRGLAEHWKREDLAEFIANPEAFVARDPRLAEQKARYPMAMPGDASLSREARLAIADWMLAH